MYSSLVFSLPYDSLPLYSSYLLQARNQKSLLDIDSVQSSLLGVVRWGEKALFSIMVSGVFELTFFCLSVYLPNTGPTFQFLRWKKSQDFSSYKYKAKYSFSHMYIQSPSQFSTFLDFSFLTLNPRKWHTFSTVPPPLLLYEHFPVTKMPFLNLPSSKVYPSFKLQNRFPCFKKTSLSPFNLELFFQYHLKTLLNWIETFSHRMMITFGRRKQLYFPVKNSEFKCSRDSFKAYIIILHLGFISP